MYADVSGLLLLENSLNLADFFGVHSSLTGAEIKCVFNHRFSFQTSFTLPFFSSSRHKKLRIIEKPSPSLRQRTMEPLESIHFHDVEKNVNISRYEQLYKAHLGNVLLGQPFAGQPC